ncbi:TonB-dependent siderophore receptor [Roseiterribacter gracilis]|uniref:Ferrichrome receptor FiuA n=1 Tax=Roseiterribacter gracilis TaxID=2812848 RepID=A0A8S8X6V3_9PROT|nr:ferrichrome receptor FiuA [Rhodospirillales bacterium TMPK1]
MVVLNRTGLGRALFLLLATAAPVALAQQAAAQQAGGELEQVVVTAPRYVATRNLTGTKIDTPLVETPQSISVINRDQIDLLNWQSLQQVVRYTAGAVGENYGPDERYDWITVRGFNPIQYVDGLQAPIGSVTNVGLDLYGSDSIEILKGPASVLYGQTPPGGIINMTSRRPQRYFGGEAGAQLGSFNQKQISGDVFGPANDYLSFRLTGLLRDRHTQTEGVRSKRDFVAPAGTLNLGNATQITLLSYYQYDKIKGDGGGFLPAQGTLLFNPKGELPVGFNAGEPGYNFYKRDQYGVGYDFSHRFSDALTVRQNLKYFSSDASTRQIYGAGLQADLRTLNRYSWAFDEKVMSFNVDTRLEAHVQTGALSHAIVGGVDFRRVNNATDTGFAFGPTLDVFKPIYGAAIAPVATSAYLRQIQKQTGVYVQDQIKLGGFIVTAGVRQDWVDTTDFGKPTSNDKFTYRVALSYLFDNGFAPYVVHATSFQPTSGADFGGTPFKPTTGEQTEIGLKYDPGEMAKGVKAFATIAAYQLRQTNVLTNDPNPAHPFFSVQAGEVEVKGVEAELTGRFYETFTVNASYTYTDPTVTKSNGPDLGKRLPAVAKHKVSLFGDYTIQSGALAGLGFGIGGRYLTETFGDPANLWRTGNVLLFDGIVHYDFDKWRLALNGNNLFDKTYVQRCSSNDQCFYAQRGYYTVSLTRKF